LLYRLKGLFFILEETFLCDILVTLDSDRRSDISCPGVGLSCLLRFAILIVILGILSGPSILFLAKRFL
jgi:hypothetical protein